MPKIPKNRIMDFYILKDTGGMFKGELGIFRRVVYSDPEIGDYILFNGYKLLVGPEGMGSKIPPKLITITGDPFSKDETPKP